MANKIKSRRGTAAAWTSANPVLLAGEIGIETDTRRMKVGDGATAWTALDYFRDDGVDWGDITEIPAPVTALSGTNTGDETTASILEKLEGAAEDANKIGAEYLPDALTWASGDPNIPEILTITGITTPADSDPLTLTRGEDISGVPSWELVGGLEWTMSYVEGTWSLADGDAAVYAASKTDAAGTPVGLTGWTISAGAGQPVITGDNPAGDFLGQWCRAATAWWQWNGTAWVPRFSVDGDSIAYNATLSAYRKIVVSGADGSEIITISAL
jgi:hypothetical protein